jgi:hypothetical protein
MYPNQTTQYPPTPPMPQYPQQPGYAPQYAQPVPPMPQYAPQAYAPQYAQPVPPMPTGTLDKFYEQPSGGGGPSWKFNGKPVGTSYAGIVARTITNSDVRAQTDNAGRPVTYKDGRPKFVLVVPMQVQPAPEFPDGLAGWWVKGQARDELARAMAEAGAPAGPPEAGAAIRVTLVGQRPVPNMNPQFIYRIEYIRPQNAAPVQQSVPGSPAPPVVHQQSVPPTPAQAPPQNGYYGPTDAERQQAASVPAPAGFTEEQAALFAKLTGQG